MYRKIISWIITVAFLSTIFTGISNPVKAETGNPGAGQEQQTPAAEYEAEAAENLLQGQAAITELPGASGGYAVSLSAADAVGINGINAVNSGEYSLIIYYAASDTASINVGVNSAPASQTAAFSSSGGQINTYALPVSLTAGDNTIKIEAAEGTILLDKVVLDAGSSSFEAESASNSLRGGASTSDNSNASGGSQVNNLDQNGGVIFENLEVDHAGKYILTLSYCTKDPRNFKMVVNEGTGIQLDCPSTSPDSWDTVGTYNTTVEMNQGINTIAFFSYDYGPNLDKITLHASIRQGLPPYPSYEGTLYEAEAEGNTVEGTVKDNTYASGGKYVINLGSKALTFNNINVEEDGYYKITVLYSVGDNTRYFNLSVNDGAPLRIPTPSTQFWDKIGKAETVVSLRAGSNKLKFDNGVTGWAPNLDAIAVAAGASAPEEPSAGDVYEAENADFGNGAERQGNASASGAEQVGNLGDPSRNGFVTFSNVQVKTGGSYTLSVYYVSGSDDRSFDLSVNGALPVRIACPKTGDDWSTVGKLDISIVLGAGQNSIRFDNASWYAPNLDKISVANLPAVYEAEASRNIFGGNASISLNSHASSGVQVGNLGGDQNGSLKFTNINVDQTGDYLMRVDYSSGSDRAFDIRVNELPGVRLTCPAVVADDWETIGSVYLPVKLTQGSNTVKFDNKSGYSPNLDSIAITKGISSYEAENPANTLQGGAVISSDSPEDSGRRHIGNLGGGGPEYGSVQFNDVRVKASGIYKLTAYYISGSDDRYFTVGINGGAPVRLNCPNSGGWSVVGRIETLVALNEGSNTINFGSDYYAPNLDKIEISEWPLSYEAEDPSNTFENGATVDSNPKDSGEKHAGNLGDGWMRFNHVNVNTAGEYRLTLYYISGSDDRSFDISVNGTPALNIPCPKSDDDWSQFAPIDLTVQLNSGDNTIRFSKAGGYAPNLDRIELATNIAVPVPTPDIITMTGGKVSLQYDLSTGTADFYYDGIKKISGFYSGVQTGELLTSKDYEVRSAVTEGTETVITSEKPGYPTMKQKFILEEENSFLVQVSLEGENLSSNWMSPIMTDSAGSADIGSYNDNRALVVPFDNDKWVRYNAGTINREDLSYEVGAFYSNSSRNGLIIGSVDHDTWKTGIYFKGADNRLDRLYAFGGAASSDTRDTGYHGSITGDILSSPRIFVGYNADWRLGMEEFAAANAAMASKLDWDGGVPFGWNSWGKIQSSINYDKATAVSNFVQEELQNNGFSNNDTVYINLDSYWDNMNDQQLAAFVENCRSNGQKAGIYWAPFVDWGKNQSRQVEGSSYTYQDIWLKNSAGSPMELDGAYALDPTHPGTKERINYFIGKFKQAGFEYIKLDFLTHGSMEGGSNNGIHYDPEVHTGIQAYNQGMHYVNEQIGGTMFISLAISPVFPYQYAHARRIACDSYGAINETEYTMNSVTYGWWLGGTLYEYNDPDHLVLEGYTADENMSRITSGVVAGTVFLNGDDLTAVAGQNLARQYLTNRRVNEVAKIGKPFVPVEGNSGTGAVNTLVLKDGSTFYIAVFNYGSSNATVGVDLARAGLDGTAAYDAAELWSGENATARGTLEAAVNAKGAKLYKLTPAVTTPTGPSIPSGGSQAGNTDSGRNVTVKDDEFIKKVKEAVASGKPDTVKLEVPENKNAPGYSISLPPELFAAQSPDLKAEIRTNLATVILPAGMFSAEEIKGRTDISLEIKNDRGTDTKNNRPAVEIGVNIDGKTVEYSNPKVPILVRIPYTPAPEELENQEHLVVLSTGEDGKTIPVPSGRYNPSAGTVSFRTVNSGKYFVDYVFVSFKDAAGVNWIKKPVEVLASKGVIEGISGETFGLNEELSRGTFINWLIKALDLNVEFSANFTDVDGKNENYKAIGIARELGITTGTGKGRFSPDSSISREEMMVLTAKALKTARSSPAESSATDLKNFKDASDISNFAKEAISTLVGAGYVTGSQNSLTPRKKATRAQGTSLLYTIYKSVDIEP